MAKGKLTPKQQRFVEEYLVDRNASAAYIRAGYRVKNENVAKVEAHRLLTNPNVVSAIAKGAAKITERTEVTQDWVVQKLVIEADSSGEGSSPSARVRALELIGKHLNMFVERHEVTGKDGKPLVASLEVIERYARIFGLIETGGTSPREVGAIEGHGAGEPVHPAGTNGQANGLPYHT